MKKNNSHQFLIVYNIQNRTINKALAVEARFARSFQLCRIETHENPKESMSFLVFIIIIEK